MQREKKKRGKGKGKGKGKKVKKKCIDERETLAYEQEILDNNRQLARLRSRNEELEEEAGNIKAKLAQLEEDRSDIIAYLKRNLNEKTEEASELSQRLSALEELRKDELAIYKKKRDAMELEYRTMENNLSAEVKLVAGKLNALEDWRLARLDLMQKFEDQEKEMAEQEERHQEALYKAEKSVVVGKALLQKEMKEHLQILSRRLLKAITLRITDVMNRAIRENVSLNRELDKLLKTNRELETVNSDCKKAEQTLRLKYELVETESNITISRTLKQRDAIHRAVTEFQMLLARYGQIERSNSRLKELQQTLKNIIEEKDEILDTEVKQYEKNILLARQENKVLSEEIEDKERQLDRLKTILNKVNTFLHEALQIAEEAYINQQCIGCMGPKMLHSLMEILDTDIITSAVNYTASELDNIDCKYTLGCLGLIEPIKEMKDRKHEEISEKIDEDAINEEIEEESSRSLKEIPSCLLSDISSGILSPKEID